MKHKHAELLMQYAQDAMETDDPWRRWEWRYDAEWIDCIDNITWSNHIDYRRKWNKKPVDLSVLIESGIDCEFSFDWKSKPSIGQLLKIDGNKYTSDVGHYYNYCLPRMNHWQSWQGGECPLPEGIVVETIYREDSMPEKNVVTDLFWKHHSEADDIIAFKVIGLADGYCWPWEIE